MNEWKNGLRRAVIWLRDEAPYWVVGVAVFTYCVKILSSFDYWTHLAFGKAFWRARSFIIPEPFLFHGEGVTSFLGEKPFQIIIYGIRELVGDDGVSFFVALMALLTFIPFLIYARRHLSTMKSAAYLLFLLATLFIVELRILPRPEVMGYVAFTFSFLLASRIAERPVIAQLWGIMALFLIWATVHITWTMGLVVVGAYLVLRFRWAMWKPVLESTMGRVTLVALVISGALGAYGLIQFGLHVLEGMRAGGRMATITEMQPAWKYTGVAIRYCIIAGVGLGLSWGGKEGRLARLIVWALAFAAGLAVVRNIAFGLFAIAFVAGEGLAGWRLPLLTRRQRFSLPAIVSAWMPVLAVAVGIGVLLYLKPHPFKTGVAWERFPRDAAAFVKEQGIPGPIFNNFDIGGFLNFAWAGSIKTFIDGRSLGGTKIAATHTLVLNGLHMEAVFKEYGINTIVISGMWYDSGLIFPLIPSILNNPDWVLVRATDGLVFTRRKYAGKMFASRRDLWRYVDGYGMQLGPVGRPHLLYSLGMARLAGGNVSASLNAFLGGMSFYPELQQQYKPFIEMAYGLSKHKGQKGTHGQLKEK